MIQESYLIFTESGPNATLKGPRIEHGYERPNDEFQMSKEMRNPKLEGFRHSLSCAEQSGRLVSLPGVFYTESGASSDSVVRMTQRTDETVLIGEIHAT